MFQARGQRRVVAEHDGSLGLRAAKVIPGGVNSGQRREGLEELVVTATSGATFTDANGRTTPTTTRPSGRRCSGTTTRTSTVRWHERCAASG